MTPPTIPEQPTPPEELWGVHDAVLEAEQGPLSFDFWGVFTSKEEAEADIAKYDLPSKTPVLIGVHPRHREAMERIKGVMEKIGSGLPDHALNAWLLQEISLIIAASEACGKSDAEGEG